MYIDWIKLQNFRTFRDVRIELLHTGTDFNAMQMPRPKIPNMNLLLGDNGLGKSAVLKAIALAALGPAVRSAGIYPYRLVRREPGAQKTATSRSTKKSSSAGAMVASIEAEFEPCPQDHVPPSIRKIQSLLAIEQRGDLEELEWRHHDDKSWHPVYSSESDAFFVVGYGATRHVERSDRANLSVRKETSFVRAQRVLGLFQESFPLIPLITWLPRIKKSNRGRYVQVEHLINRLLGHGHYTLAGEMEGDEYVFERGGLRIPFPAMSDGYRAFLGWVGDLLYHVVRTCPKNKKLVDNQGIVMVDEIDLHLHPKWQLTVLPTLAKALPNIQFIVTSHSPLVVGSLEWMNILLMEPDGTSASIPRRITAPVHGLDADQVLLTDFFGMNSTRAGDKEKRLKQLTLEARKGDLDAAASLMDEMSAGAEKDQMSASAKKEMLAATKKVILGTRRTQVKSTTKKKATPPARTTKTNPTAKKKAMSAAAGKA